MGAVSFAFLLLCSFVSTTTSQARPSAERAFVGATRAHIRKRPSKSAPIVVTVPISTEVRRGRSRAGFARVRLVTGEKGYISARHLVKERPQLSNVLRSFGAAAPGSRARRSYIEKATALAPGDLDVIEHLQAELLARGDKKWNYFARKGWIAAKRRTLMWDGPLYPIVDGRAHIPAPCDARATANTGRSSKKIGRLELRGRAFPLVSSGKVVSVTATKNLTQKLNAPGCDDGNLVYQLHKKTRKKWQKDGRGALVASWLVAGHTVLPFVPHARLNDASSFFYVAGRFRIDFYSAVGSPKKWTLTEGTFDGDVTSDRRLLLASPRATPVAIFFDETEQLRVLWWAPDLAARASLDDGGERSEDDCKNVGPVSWLTRFRPANKGPFESAHALATSRTDVVEGRLWLGRATSDCGGAVFVPLDGEPRDISHEKLESNDWKQ